MTTNSTDDNIRHERAREIDREIRTVDLQPGDLAYMDTLRSGPVPVKIIADNAPLPTFKVQVTATRYAYPCGHVLNRRKSQVIPKMTIHIVSDGSFAVAFTERADAERYCELSGNGPIIETEPMGEVEAANFLRTYEGA